MAVPTYDKFIEPVLRFLAYKPDGVPARDAHEAAADTLNIDDNQRTEVIARGQLVYKNRAMIALNEQGYLKAYPEESGVYSRARCATQIPG